ncbi:hypothetical protein HDU84_003360, partial [Entophlyctis sp. JEL0112]
RPSSSLGHAQPSISKSTDSRKAFISVVAAKVAWNATIASSPQTTVVKQDSAVAVVGSQSDSSNDKSEFIFKLQRTEDERELNPERLNLNRKKLKVETLSGVKTDQLMKKSNEISKIEHLENLKNLVFLDFYNNKIECMKGFDELVNLRVLMLGKNRITRIENLQRLLKLDVLDLHYNQILRIENMDHLNALRILNLEGNLISHVEKLPSCSLTELNLKRNRIASISELPASAPLKRLILTNNRLFGFEHVLPILSSQSLLELWLDENPINSDQYYRLIFANRVKTLRYLDGRRVGEEERRTAMRIARKEGEKRKESARAIGVAEERRRITEEIEFKWHGERNREQKKLNGFVEYFRTEIVTNKKDINTGFG